MISAVLLAWRRIGNLESLIGRYSHYSLIDEIIIFNNNKNYNLEYLASYKTTIIQSSKDLGLFSRFAAAGLAKNDCIIHLDDDIFIPEITMGKLYEKWLENPTICHGLIGRIFTENYYEDAGYGDAHIVLTSCLVVNKEVCLEAFKFCNFFNHLDSQPKGNGEDIIISFISMTISGCLNRIYNLPYDILEGYSFNNDGSTYAISRRWSGHNKFRGELIERCKQLLKTRLSNIKL